MLNLWFENNTARVSDWLIDTAEKYSSREDVDVCFRVNYAKSSSTME